MSAWNIKADKRCMSDKGILTARANLNAFGKLAERPAVTQGYTQEQIENAFAGC
jgi:hypothetical protein